jgi:ParB-like chromosome segregation protein Spo0J
MTEDDRTVTVRIPLVFRKHGGRKTVISPDGGAWERPQPLLDSALVRALARAFRWQRLLDEGVHATFDDLAKAEGVSQSHVSRMLRLTLLAPEIVEAILAGRQPEGMRLEGLLAGFPDGWASQRQSLSASLPI